MQTTLSLLVGFILGVLARTLSDVIREEYRRFRERRERRDQYRDEVKKQLESMYNVWYVLKDVDDPRIDLRQDIIRMIRDTLEYLSYYSAYGGRKNISEELRQQLQKIASLCQPTHSREEWLKSTREQMEEELRKLLELSKKL